MGVVKGPVASRGQVWLTRLDPMVGREIRKTRPCLVVSPDGMNRHLGTAIVMPLTSGSALTRFRVPVTFAERDGLILGDQTRSVARERLLKLVGDVDEPTLSAALGTLREMFEE
jgi:mRNA interferase MazF